MLQVDQYIYNHMASTTLQGKGVVGRDLAFAPPAARARRVRLCLHSRPLCYSLRCHEMSLSPYSTDCLVQTRSKSQQAVNAHADQAQAQSVSRRQAILLSGSLAASTTLSPASAPAAETVRAVGIDSTETIQLGQSGQQAWPIHELKVCYTYGSMRHLCRIED